MCYSLQNIVTMKSFVVFASVLVIAMAQRPGYLGSGPIGYPGLASRFKDDSQTSAPGVNNRLGETGGSTPKIPVDARGDAALAERLNTWPREHRPFWLLNAEHIEAQRGGSSSSGQAFQTQNLQGRFGNPEFNFEQDDFQPDAFDDFGNPVQTRTIRPVLTRGSFAGSL